MPFNMAWWNRLDPDHLDVVFTMDGEVGVRMHFTWAIMSGHGPVLRRHLPMSHRQNRLSLRLVYPHARVRNTSTLRASPALIDGVKDDETRRRTWRGRSADSPLFAGLQQVAHDDSM